MNDVSYATFSYEQKSSPTNAFSSSVENEIIKRDEHLREKIEGLKKKKAKTIALKQKISNSLTSLNDEEYKLIELRYFDTKNKKKTWLEIGMILGVDITTCHRIKNKILNNLIDCIYISV
ncbi:MAG: xanthine dehydrogenase [Clostridium sp.]|uniref:xanthine dehydrogenase n=1 Tax=Clostridium sp. TaxID=1506 RepID=UPI00290241DB|nr:xanthine dehydrogenase [Clostridium sp.]MDU2895696.1 xanthine dehydrogenase [Clostridium sp.]MDU3008088.1 xanthine dehydrogenase [Clostridium sp.]MDU3037963.1 xanthine dehydrogenase [Clostridium sp.]MDU3052921.1 xanthine dehydrogenase [Clostridium sp.]